MSYKYDICISNKLEKFTDEQYNECRLIVLVWKIKNDGFLRTLTSGATIATQFQSIFSAGRVWGENRGTTETHTTAEKRAYGIISVMEIQL